MFERVGRLLGLALGYPEIPRRAWREIGRDQTVPLERPRRVPDVERLSRPCAWGWGRARPGLHDANNNQTGR